MVKHSGTKILMLHKFVILAGVISPVHFRSVAFFGQILLYKNYPIKLFLFSIANWTALDWNLVRTPYIDTYFFLKCHVNRNYLILVGYFWRSTKKPKKKIGLKVQKMVELYKLISPIKINLNLTEKCDDRKWTGLY